jgi:indole-3-glycerol phosphate synthase
VGILDEIVAHKRLEAGRLPPLTSPPDALAPRRTLAGALREAGPVALIAEIKRRSPSRPLLRPDFDPAGMATAYASGGAAALSVVTDARYFGGALDHLDAARAACGLPLLRKDFILDPRQISEAKLAGADAVLLIAACLSDADLGMLASQAARWDLEVLVEVHDERELARAIALEFPLVGINNRDLGTFEVDLATTERLCRQIADRGAPRRPQIVSESGIATPADVRRLAACGCDAVLVGESLMTHADLAAATARLVASVSGVGR